MSLLKGQDLFSIIYISFLIIIYSPGSEPYNPFKDRAEFGTEDFSLLLKNLGLNDGGLYQAVIQYSNKEEILAEHMSQFKVCSLKQSTDIRFIYFLFIINIFLFQIRYQLWS